MAEVARKVKEKFESEGILSKRRKLGIEYMLPDIEDIKRIIKEEQNVDPRNIRIPEEHFIEIYRKGIPESSSLPVNFVMTGIYLPVGRGFVYVNLETLEAHCDDNCLRYEKKVKEIMNNLKSKIK